MLSSLKSERIAESGNIGEVVYENWDVKLRHQIGSLFLHLALESTNLFQTRLIQLGRHKRRRIIEPTEAVRNYITTHIIASEEFSANRLPCVVPPRPWENLYEGGYWFMFPGFLNLIQSNIGAHTANVISYRERLSGNTSSMESVYSAVNTLQNSAYRINKRIYEVASYLWQSNLSKDIAKMPAAVYEQPPPKPPAYDLEALVIWRREAAETHRQNRRDTGKRILYSNTLKIAKDYLHEKEFYFPVTMDFRGRLYTVGAFLNPQGDDLARSLLLFSRSEIITKDDIKSRTWLMIHGANAYGYDKVSFEDRIEWTFRHNKEILSIAEDPLGSPYAEMRKGEASKPWGFLAFCFEYASMVDAFSKDMPFRNHLPVNLDGSCNGLQHFSMLLRDPVGAVATNLKPTLVPSDIYQEVADKTTELLKEDKDNDFAYQWLKYGIDRNLVKRPVMITPYSGTRHTIKNCLEETVKERIRYDSIFPPWFDPEHKNRDHFHECRYLSKKVMSAIEEVVSGAKGVMEWLRAVSDILAKKNEAIEWITPDGLLIMQDYRVMSSTRVQTILGTSAFKATLRGVETKSKKNKPKTKKAAEIARRNNQNGISPNFIHSLDASMLRMYINKINQDTGIKDMLVVHDSFGTHATNVDESRRCLREAFVEMYRECPLESFKRDIEHNLSVELPPLPEKRGFDIEQVLKSDYCFS